MQSLCLQPPSVFPSTVAGQSVRITASPESGLDWSDRPGKSSPRALRWRLNGAAELTFETPIGFVPWSGAIEDNRIATFSFWIHGAAPLPATLRVAFGRGDRIDCHFDFQLGFQGWRTAWVAFERDMQGTPRTDMNTIRVTVIDGPATGELLLDHIIPCALVDHRYHDQDAQVPFINAAAAARDRGMVPLCYPWSRLPAPAPWSDAAVATAAGDLETITSRLDEALVDHGLTVTEERLKHLMAKAEEWGFTPRSPRAPRPTVWNAILFSASPNHAALRPPPAFSAMPPMSGVSFTDYTNVMLDVAQTWRAAADRPDVRTQLGRLFLDLEDHLVDQGWAADHASGTMTLCGYWGNRGYGPALWLMRDVLREAGRLDRAARALAWYFGVGADMDTTTPRMRNAMLDFIHTLAQGRLIAILMMPDRALGAAHLRQFAAWLAFAVGDSSPGLEGGFKPDGSPFHHGGFYMGYAAGAYLHGARLIHVLSRTRFRVAAAAHAHFRKSLLMARRFANLTDWPPSLCGRRPTSLALPVEAFGRLARAGTPAGDSPVDDELARAYLRLAAPAPPTPLVTAFTQLGLIPEAPPRGHWDMNCGALAIHRRGDWAATAKGHSRYVWTHETYPGENMYGRYQSFGTLFIANTGTPVSARASGFALDGWDWNRWPGTTAVHLPWDLLRADLRVIDAVCGREETLFSDQTFAGGAALCGQGVFGLNLHGHAKYCPGFHALKSVFFFDNRLVCLGSGITHTDTVHPVETTLFQAALADPGQPLYVNDAAATDALPWSTMRDGKHPTWVVNHLRQGYYVHPGTPLHLRRQRQTSPDHTDQTMTSGDFAVAWLDHGHAPRDGAYSYCVVVDTDPAAMRAWATTMDDPDCAPYRILRHDRRVHAVVDRATGISAGVIFAPVDDLALGPVRRADKPCLVLLRADDDGWELALCNPNLNLAPDIPPPIDEFSIYGCPWIGNESRPDPVEITLDGHWNLVDAEPAFTRAAHQGSRTVITCTCRHGLTVRTRLTPA